MKKYHENSSKGFFDSEYTVQSLSEMGNPLDMLDKHVDFEMFMNFLEDVVLPKERKSNAGRSPIDPVMMFKVLILQRYYGLGDEQIEYHNNQEIRG